MLLKKAKILLGLIYTLIYSFSRGASVGRMTVIWPGARVKRQDGGSISIGDNCEIAKGAMLLTHGGSIHLGDRCTVQPYAVLYGHGGLQIGHDVRIAAHVVVVPSNHSYADKNIPIAVQPLEKKGIKIGNDVWIGAGARILDGVEIGDGCVIAAGAVVTKSTDPYSINVGVPSRKVGVR